MERKEGSSFTWNKNKVYRILKKEEYMGDILTYKTISIDYLTHRQVKNKGLSVQYYIKDHHRADHKQRIISYGAGGFVG